MRRPSSCATCSARTSGRRASRRSGSKSGSEATAIRGTRVNRIFCIGRNYAEHVRELGHAPDESCVVFMKPPSCVVPPGAVLRLPAGRGAVHHEAELVLMLSGGGRDVPEADALRHVAGVTLGLDLTLRDLQNDLKRKGAPWELCKAFDGAAPLGDWQPFEPDRLAALEFECRVNGEPRQHGRVRDMLFPPARLIHILSASWSLTAGDVVFTGTPAGVGPLKEGDRVSVEGATLGRYEWSCA